MQRRRMIIRMAIMNNKKFHIDGIKDIAAGLLSLIQESGKNDSATVIALSGDLGAGKTTLVKEIARQLEITDPVISPTFVIMKKYGIRNTTDFENLIHIDAYRLDSGAELSKLGWTEIVSDKKNLVFVEWPERVADLIPKDCINVSLEHCEEGIREISVK